MSGRRQLCILGVATVVVRRVTALAPTDQAVGRPTTLTVCAVHGNFHSIQSAIDAAHNGATVRVCPGTYVEGGIARGSNALTIRKDVTLVGAGADQVHVQARKGARLAEPSPDLHSGRGDLVAVIRSDVDISGMTFDANGARSAPAWPTSIPGARSTRSR